VNTNILQSAKTIAIIGLSDNPKRPSYDVASYLQSQGYRIIPVNPNVNEILGEKSYPDILSIPKEIQLDIIDIFRKSELVTPHVEEAIKRGDAKMIWMQEGVINEHAATLARNAGIEVMMNFCLMKTHKKTTTP
jgi:predicted CoA-binding protein